ncbi:MULTISPECIES: alpha-L-fucosidase [unclassified Lentimonas]|uniref:alpha-L-fucosidase n=1 Tax=unclassified Lentimonas TaxID=2630993 RepID=UPI001329C2D0|nr:MULTISPECIES: alpha-L-fucosidase [unclassified Lentimonas]CAA6678658.1 Alpha-L-fucosidase (EC [Lentimonas sp. CC4]CAA6683644.1 Alpha-L-fucosidase (EC [Lentimonas sp. CC6]CAA7074510.1 Alpha-L-fucosidase (EC [Lentimonas sp. CC4]CAA7169122.1 Alpha-L-fucosidase (EC [Lentimonas sp. CC21]CAA7180473.1 Alpha-L-fucosidase (EC [Lentimonas sp. CC8]
MSYKHLFTISLLVASTSFAARYHAPHTDGIEPYYQPEETVRYMSGLSEEERATLFAKEGAIDWWLDARFGIFVHWGPSSMLKCSMSWGRMGPRPQHSTDGTVKKGIPQEIYDNQYKLLEAAEFDADEWIKLVKDSGAKYFLFTTKHHDGFSTYDSAVTDYDIMNTPFGRDMTREIVEACNKYDIKIGFYYSQPDWNHPLYAAGENEQYCEAFLFPQIRELLTNYGKIDIMWFDGLGRNPDTWQSPKLMQMIRELQPDIITNHRFAHPPAHMGDFDGPERSIGRFQTNRPWETCTVIGGGWAWMGDAPAMPLPQAISLLVRCAGGGGNLALGVGPNGDGEFLPDHKKRLLQMGDWLKQYGETIYGTQGGPYISGPWGAATYKDDTVYLHILANWSGKLTLPALPAKMLSTTVLSGGTAQVQQTDDALTISMDPKDINPVNTVIALKLDQSAANITPIPTISLPLSIGATATASSEKSAKHTANSIVAGDLKEFSEGIMVKSSWSPAPKDKAPWIQIELTESQSVSQIQIREGKFGAASRVKAFVLEAKVDGAWQAIYAGKRIGGDFGLVLSEPVTSDTFRLRIIKWQGGLNINELELF